jgi:CheY-like chemotaxis protein
VLSATDTGIGMTPETKARVFEPFFTTKGMAAGTGLGLSSVFGIVSQSGGLVSVDSELGVGTTFRAYFPSADPESTPPAPTTPTAARSLRGTETILLVEDEEPLRSLFGVVLRRHGYEVLQAKNGTDALAVADQHEGQIHLALTDVVMPGMGGRQLIERFRERRPACRVLYMSGYTDDVILRQGVRIGDVTLLEKPLTPDVLLRAVRSALDAPPVLVSSSLRRP